MKNSKLYFILFIFTFLFSSAFAGSITFQLIEVESALDDPTTTPWMFDLDDPGLGPEAVDGNPFTNNSPIEKQNFAYHDFKSIADPNTNTGKGPTTSSCSQNLSGLVLGDTENFEIIFDSFIISGFEKLNMLNPADAWDIAGQAGDKRIYTGGSCKIYYNNNLVLQIDNSVVEALVDYPSAEEMQVQIPTWQNEIGRGIGTDVTGWGFVNRALSDNDWIEVFAGEGDRVDFTMNSISYIIQGFYGYYDFDIILEPAHHNILEFNEDIVVGNIPEFPILDQDISFDFDDSSAGGAITNLRRLVVFLHEEDPLGDLPVEILHTLPHYWEFSTTLGSFSTAVTFDLSSVSGTDPTQWRVLRKISNSDTWETYDDYSRDGNLITALNVSGFSYWTIGTVEDEPLPISLSSFTAILSDNNNAIINWSTKSESNLQGYNLFRATETNIESAIILNANIIEPQNTTTTSNYSYTDFEIGDSAQYFYWLESIDLDGSIMIYGPAILYNEQFDPTILSPVDLWIYLYMMRKVGK